MTAFLLIWSPRKWPWPELPDICAEVARRQALSLSMPVPDSWGCGFSRGLVPGDRVFIHRVAQEPKGLFASGWVTRAPYEVPDPQRKRGYRLVIDFTYDWLVDAHHEVVITREELRSHPFSVQQWDAQSSGNLIKPMVEGPLEKLWAQRTGARRGPPAPASAQPARGG
ncbi:hypothetical protein [Burkholderia sp. L27(2015)]|uniref:hypothetical protein n=1 Tax=Burkholderia sp. L27(2015) TaxID=1641858 RepID=UPI00131C20ED|nr:hypothetical protein [Burkholderia sp. L27(2015)]